MNEKTKSSSGGININVSPTISPVINQSVKQAEKESEATTGPSIEKEPWYKRWQSYVAIAGGMLAAIWVIIQIINHFSTVGKSDQEQKPKIKTEQIQKTNTTNDSIK
ncbi:MAG: hypothetical protein Q8S39_12685 [Ignavibacteria bacterium]|nr:hypothetical protein [Ignavibacteria bacterium]